MFAQNLLVPGFALLSVAAAQTATICTQPSVTINSPADASQIADCSTIGGSIIIGSDANGIIALDGPSEVKGNLTSLSAGNLVSITSSTINKIGGEFRLFNLTLLSNLQFDVLKSVKTIYWEALPTLPQLNFAGPLSQASSVTISNTFLSTLTGINLNTVGTLQIDNNNNLKSFDTQVANITNALNINANGNQLAVTFPNLIWAANMTFRNISSIKFPSLATVNGSLGFYDNYMESISAPNLTTIGNFATSFGSMAIVTNEKLTNITFPMLKSVGGANQIANNTNLNAISFPSLSQVAGAIDFSGNFSTPELPKLSDVKGGFNVQSKQVISCEGFQAQSGGKGSIIQGKFICKSATATTTTLDGTTTDGSTKSSPTPKSDAASYHLSEAALGASIFAGLLQLIL
ncbi:related to sporulation-specific protein 2 precursor [Rhynchosporium graminicola]|uniref:Related to sporulation-specific protein 2 n=1 Tax=Rhynchosporium graminicola TaxID=2792576 RepID=A0A1E1LE10_9HELO|nr:related to sporulation-specific protein 2 precursor [Rhynchosporium commune]